MRNYIISNMDKQITRKAVAAANMIYYQKNDTQDPFVHDLVPIDFAGVLLASFLRSVDMESSYEASKKGLGQYGKIIYDEKSLFYLEAYITLITFLNFHLSGSSVRNIEQKIVASRRRKRSKKSRKTKKGIICMQFLDIIPIKHFVMEILVDCFFLYFRMHEKTFRNFSVFGIYQVIAWSRCKITE